MNAQLTNCLSLKNLNEIFFFNFHENLQLYTYLYELFVS